MTRSSAKKKPHHKHVTSPPSGEQVAATLWFGLLILAGADPEIAKPHSLHINAGRIYAQHLQDRYGHAMTGKVTRPLWEAVLADLHHGIKPLENYVYRDSATQAGTSPSSEGPFHRDGGDHI